MNFNTIKSCNQPENVCLNIRRRKNASSSTFESSSPVPRTITIPNRTKSWKLQSETVMKDVCNSVVRKLPFSYFGKSVVDNEWIISQMEDIVLLAYNLYSANDFTQMMVAVVTYFKCRLGPNSSVIKRYIKFFQARYEDFSDYYKVGKATSRWMMQGSTESPFSSPREFLDHYFHLKKSPFFTKIYDMILFCLSRNIFDGLGINFESLNFKKCESEAIKQAHSSNVGFLEQIADTIVYLCETGYQIIMTGTLSPIYHSGSKYAEWYDDCTWLRDCYPKLDDCESFGFSFAQFYEKLKSTIEKGDAIYKHAVNMSPWDKKAVLAQIQPLKVMCTEIDTSANARLPRLTPFSVLLFGNSGIGKSTLIEILFTIYGRKRNLPVEGKFKYTRNPNAEFWDGYMPSQWCCILDDVGFREPRTAGQGDNTTTEFLQIVNQVPFCPNQADLSKKGMNPFKSEFVVATTNVKDMNAYAYFSCPSAAQRRFPYVITPKVKSEYCTNSMLDSAKVRELEVVNEIPDYWTFTVERVNPRPIDGCKQNAEYVKILDDVSMADFLIWFNLVVDQHWENQGTVSKSLKRIHDAQLCKCCGIPMQLCKTNAQVPMEPQAGIDMIVPSYFGVSPLSFLIFLFVIIYNSLDSFFLLVDTFYHTYRMLSWVGSIKSFFRDPIAHLINRRTYWQKLGDRVRCRVGYDDRLLQISTIMATVSTLSLLWKTFSYFKPKNKEETKFKAQDFSEDNTFRAPTAKEHERDNVWFNTDIDLAKLDISDSCRAMFNQEKTLAKKIERNLIYCELQDSIKKVKCRMLCIKDQYYIANNHCVLENDFDLKVIQSSSASGVNRNLIARISQASIYRDVKHDLAIIKIACLPPRKSLIKYFLPGGFTAKLKGEYIEIDERGVFSRNPVEHITDGGEQSARGGLCIHIWAGVSQKTTYDGYCGTPLIVSTPQGPAIAGIHALGSEYGNNVGCTRLTSDYLEYALSNLLTIDISKVTICSDNIKRDIGDLHQKSVFRYIEQGTANIYGSFEGYRPSPRTSVHKTMLCDEFLARGYEMKFTAPLMRGWKPWRIAAMDLVNPVLTMDQGILETVAEDFVIDILLHLPASELANLHKYDRHTAINGMPGVAYVDSINRNSSMGLPFRCPKTKYLEKLPSDQTYQDPVRFTDEINRRIDRILLLYSKGKRAYPIYNACLKDEAVSLEKREKGKTRVFSSAPIDFSIVVRMYLLSFVRVVQNNKFVFESCPGTICQSSEWGQMRDFVTKYGTKNMIAGDFKAFDKRMSAQIIEMAFSVIIQVLKASGNFSEEDLRAIMCICADVRFPLTDFNGDLVEFYGSNPSGWPLTVIINGLVNCLYMRYAYAILSKDASARNFRDNVALLTYGDDNIMGVHSRCKWFNHTSISKVLGDYDITYTMADKQAESIPYIPFQQCEFLKRTWRWDDAVQNYLCPLNNDSIEKMLTVCTRSKMVIHEVQMCAIMDSALQEYFNYGREVFDSKRALFTELVGKYNLQPYLIREFPTFDELVSRWMEASSKL